MLTYIAGVYGGVVVKTGGEEGGRETETEKTETERVGREKVENQR